MSRLIYSCILFLLVSVGISSCRSNPKYCEGAPDNNCDNLIDGSAHCTSNEQCAEPSAVCDVTGSMACVQCTPDQAGACSGKTPVCGDDHSCRGCSAHSDCPGSDTCLPDGSCADPEQTAYVQAGGTGAPPCAKATPCGTLQEGITAVNATRPYIKVSNAGGGVLAPNATTTIDGKSVIILAEPGAKLDRTGDGVNLEVRNTGADVQIYDLEISGASGAGTGFGLSLPAGTTATITLTRVKVSGNQAGGITTSGGSLTVSQSTISGNNGGGVSATGGTLTLSQSTISVNIGGGISIATGVNFDITNCFIVRNGNSTTTSVGGIYLGGSGSTSVLAFNTIVDNQAKNGSVVAGGVLCDDPGFAASNNIIAHNFVNNEANQSNSNTLGLCTHSSTTIASTVAGLNFVSPDNEPYDYHIQRGSSAIDQATTPSTLAVDVDGDSRPQGNARDRGADEAP
jgi:hypothetical protein